MILGSANSSQNAGSSEAGMIRAPAPMMRCSKIMHMMRDLHPTLLSALEGIVDQVYSLIYFNYEYRQILLFVTLIYSGKCTL